MVSEGWHSLPESVPALSEAAEKEVIHSLLAVLNDAFGVNLDLDPCMARDAASICDQREADASAKYVAFVGNSHARRTVSQMEATGTLVSCLTDKDWKLNKDDIRKLVEEIEQLDTVPDLLVVHALDNNAYFVGGDDGTLSLPRKGADRKFHITGNLCVATKDQTVMLMKLILPLLEAEPEIPKILVLPMPRYCHPGQKCCLDPEHLTNAGSDLFTEVRTALTNMKRTIRSFLFQHKVMGVKLLDPGSVVNMADPSSYTDPVHLTATGYAALAEHIIAMLAGTAEGDKAADRPDAGSSKRIRILSMSATRGAGSGSGLGRGNGPFRGRGRAGRGGRGRLSR
jgi:lysophospholipase L1-like esterase